MKNTRRKVLTAITCVSLIVGYVEARVAEIRGQRSGVRSQESEVREPAAAIPEVENEELFLIPIPLVPADDSDWRPRAPDPPPTLIPFPDPIGGETRA